MLTVNYVSVLEWILTGLFINQITYWNNELCMHDEWKIYGQNLNYVLMRIYKILTTKGQWNLCFLPKNR